MRPKPNIAKNEPVEIFSGEQMSKRNFSSSRSCWEGTYNPQGTIEVEIGLMDANTLKGMDIYQSMLIVKIDKV